MKKRIAIFIIFIFVLLLNCNVYASANKMSGNLLRKYKVYLLKETEDENKVWNVPFEDISEGNVKLLGVRVYNESDKRAVDIEYQLNSDGKSVDIIPLNAYEEGKTYKILVKTFVEIGEEEKYELILIFPFKIKKKIEKISYTGAVEHIFIHPLIAYPELAFDGEYSENDMDDWFITVSEFNRMLDQLYENNFILVDINSVYEEYEHDGKKLMRRSELLVPEGKKPLILSIDDLNYYNYMKKDGVVHKLILDEDGEIATFSINTKGKEVISRENECVPILNEFVKKHPDFSLNGAKGTIALTGFDGILGYRTTFDSENHKIERQAVKKIIDKLKEDGWNFASHSYGHIDFPEVSYTRVVNDTDKWKKEVESLIGETQVFIYPYGSSVNPTSDKFKYLQKTGSKIICPVGASSTEWILNITNAVITDRRHVDGISLRWQRESFLDLYDAEKIIDRKVRPKR
ncbi:polysaccharide deacetylase family protein [Oceanirhabdus seepicola]|uniref:Polysaccharide deacetylase family protein n=1 Tax=Oceanirhabdus seepicola TaxID=2828781 RepID=A0A9J6P231_9CLOT|nr:polysaccharide deacetylase family protein [Oceanirhabdus seepicola]MCM1989949.1 polysaccharide deacetylase family protein [Oceanirhabdus seepicola]